LLLGCPQPLAVLSWTMEDHLEVPGIGAEKGLLKPMVEHLIAHPAEAAASFPDAAEIGKALGQNGVTGGWPVLPFAETGKGDGCWRQAGPIPVKDLKPVLKWFGFGFAFECGLVFLRPSEGGLHNVIMNPVPGIAHSIQCFVNARYQSSTPGLNEDAC